MIQQTNNPLLCDPQTGICEIPATYSTSSQQAVPSDGKPVKITYYTDPICSSCWGIEPQLRKLKLEYGQYLKIDYRMGGLLPDWSYNSGGISKPSDVAPHWEEVSVHYQMPIDGGVWLEDPLSSSYPPSIAIKAAQLQNKDKAVNYMRKLRELLFLEKKNITRWEIMRQAAASVGLDTFRLKEDYEGKAVEMFKQDLSLAQKLGVRGFPTLFFSDNEGNQLTLYGVKPYETFENAVQTLFPGVTKKTLDLTADDTLFSYYDTLTVKEYSVIKDIPFQSAEKQLENLFALDKLVRIVVKTGVLYQKKPVS